MGDLRVPLADPHPDCGQFIHAVLTHYAPQRPALVEYGISPVLAERIGTELLGQRWVEPIVGDRHSQMAYWSNIAQVWYRLGYDCIRVELDCRLSDEMAKPDPRPMDEVGRSRCAMPGGTGPISSWEQFEDFPWPTVREPDLFAVEHLARILPTGMGIMVAYEGGMFEHLVGLMGFEGLALRLYDQPGLVDAVAERLGDIMMGHYERLLQIERVTALFPGDDLGFHSNTFLSPDHLRQYVLPWHARFAALAHEAGRPYFLHSYGSIDEIMPDLVDVVGIDAKHGFDDEICSAKDFKDRWGSRVGALGGVDSNALMTLRPDELRVYVRRVIEECRHGGGFAVGSGAYVSRNVPLENFLTMIDEAGR